MRKASGLVGGQAGPDATEGAFHDAETIVFGGRGAR
jgi:hypothetical protein